MGIGVIISLVISWRISLVAIGCSPLIFVGGAMMSKLQWKQMAKGGNQLTTKDHYRDSNALLSDIIMNYRTIISFGEKNVNFLMGHYNDLLEEPVYIGRKNAHIGGFLFGYSQFIRFAFVAFIFYIGAQFMIKYPGDGQEDVFVAIYVLFVAALGTGIAMSNCPSIGSAQESASKILNIIDEKSLIDVRDGVGIK